jgi:hypothetical protein
MKKMTPERENEIRSLTVISPLPHPIVLRDEFLAEIDKLRAENKEISRQRDAAIWYRPTTHIISFGDEEIVALKENLAMAVEALEGNIKWGDEFGSRSKQALSKIRGENPHKQEVYRILDSIDLEGEK